MQSEVLMTKGGTVLKGLAGHVRGNVVAYLALMFSVIGGGGGYAIASTTHATKPAKKTASTIVACASNTTGEMYLHHGSGKCEKGRHKVRWNLKGKQGKTGATGATGNAGAPGATGATGPAGAPAPSIFAAVDTDSVIAGAPEPGWQGLAVSRTGIGVYQVTITDATCSKSSNNVLTVTPTDREATSDSETPPAGAAPVAYISTNLTGNNAFTVNVGYVGSDGAFQPLDYYFNLQDTCLPAVS
jgi:collagen type I/II/III/V/XI/XXIV/XXVII alpha